MLAIPHRILLVAKYLCIFQGYTLAVTLEIADATLGGLAFGVGMTTYSHKVMKFVVHNIFVIM